MASICWHLLCFAYNTKCLYVFGFVVIVTGPLVSWNVDVSTTMTTPYYTMTLLYDNSLLYDDSSI